MRLFHAINLSGKNGTICNLILYFSMFLYVLFKNRLQIDCKQTTNILQIDSKQTSNILQNLYFFPTKINVENPNWV